MTVSALWLPGGRHLDVSGVGYAPQGALTEGGAAIGPQDSAMAARCSSRWFVWRQADGMAYEMVRTETFTVLAVCQWFNVLNCESATRSALSFGIVRNRWLLGGLSLSIVLQGAVLYWPPLNELFHTVPIPPADLLPIVAVASLVLWTEEARKLVVRVRSAK